MNIIKTTLLLLLVCQVACNPTKKLSVQLDGKPADADIRIGNAIFTTSGGSVNVKKNRILRDAPKGDLVFTITTSKGSEKKTWTRKNFVKAKEIVFSTASQVTEGGYDPNASDKENIENANKKLEEAGDYMKRAETILRQLKEEEANEWYKKHPNSAKLPLAEAVEGQLADLKRLKDDIEGTKKKIMQLKGKLQEGESINVDDIIKLTSTVKTIKTKSSDAVLKAQTTGEIGKEIKGVQPQIIKDVFFLSGSYREAELLPLQKSILEDIKASFKLMRESPYCKDEPIEKLVFSAYIVGYVDGEPNSTLLNYDICSKCPQTGGCNDGGYLCLSEMRTITVLDFLKRNLSSDYKVRYFNTGAGIHDITKGSFAPNANARICRVRLEVMPIYLLPKK